METGDDEILTTNVPIRFTITGSINQTQNEFINQELILSDDNTNVVIKCVQPGRRQIEWYMEPYKESMLLLKEVDNVPLSPLPWQWLLADDEKQRLSEEGALFDL